MASEARHSGYIAVARGDATPGTGGSFPAPWYRRTVPGNGQLDRTMFEYLMPELFLPLCRESLLGERKILSVSPAPARAGRFALGHLRERFPVP